MRDDAMRPAVPAVAGARRISVVVPVYNAARTLAELVSRLSAVLVRVPTPSEIILVNDGSRDESWSIIRTLADAYPAVLGLDLSRNYGQQNALLAGVAAASGDVIVTIDDDLDYEPEDIPLLLAAMDRHDAVFGRHPTASGGLLRRIAARGARWIVRGVSPYGLGGSSFRAFEASLRDTFARVSAPHASLDVLLGWSLTRPGIVHLPTKGRSPRTRYGWRSLMSLFAAALTGISVRPLHAAGWVGAFLLLAGAIGFAATLVIAPASPAGLILSAVCVLAGVQSLLLAVLGAYIGRIYFLNLELPGPSVRERAGRGLGDPAG
jgi:glycosyltransferase involved in cell wall biosynthesis